MCKLTSSDRNKLGNAVVYVAKHVSDLSKTKLLKLLYLMEEYSVRRFQTPFLGLPFEVWQAGPVVKDVFVDLSEVPVLLDGFVERKEVDGRTYVEAVAEFSDDEFSDNDVIVMDDVLKKYGSMTATDLVRLTHEEGSLWYKVAAKNGLLKAFENKLMNSSDCQIDFSEGLSGCGKEFYKEQMDFLQMSRVYDLLASLPTSKDFVPRSIEKKGRLTDAEYEAVVRCLKGSSSVKRIYRRML